MYYSKNLRTPLILKLGLTSIIALILASCGSISNDSIKKEKQEFLSEFFEIVSENSIYKDSVNIDSVSIWAFDESEKVNTMDECYSIAKLSLLKLGDHHSYISNPSEFSKIKLEQNEDGRNFTFEGELLRNHIGYINLKSSLILDSLMFGYSESLQNLLDSLNNLNCSGWIIDLRENEGGEFASMFVGIGPLIEDDTCGYYLHNSGEKEPWIYSKGHLVIDSKDTLPSIKAIESINDQRPIAVLTGPNTSSAGEAILIAFSGKENVRSFGMITNGLTTGNKMFQLKNGSILNLAVCVFVNRDGITYGGPIHPDHIIEFSPDEIGTESDSVISKAIKWIEK